VDFERSHAFELWLGRKTGKNGRLRFADRTPRRRYLDEDRLSGGLRGFECRSIERFLVECPGRSCSYLDCRCRKCGQNITSCEHVVAPWYAWCPDCSDVSLPPAIKIEPRFIKISWKARPTA